MPKAHRLHKLDFVGVAIASVSTATDCGEGSGIVEYKIDAGRVMVGAYYGAWTNDADAVVTD